MCRGYFIVKAKKSPFELKDVLRNNNYRWNVEEKVWWRKIDYEDIENERNWLTKNIYKGYFLGTIEEIPIQDKYKE